MVFGPSVARAVRQRPASTGHESPLGLAQVMKKLPKSNLRHTLLRKQHDARIQEEARLANDIQRQYPDTPRSEALRIAIKWGNRG